MDALRVTDHLSTGGRLAALRHPHMPWGFVTALEVVALAFVSAGLVFSAIPNAQDIHWGCVNAVGDMRTSADTYIAVFAVGGALGWLVATGATVFAYAAGRRWLALAIPAAWFGGLVLSAWAVAAAIGPLTC